MLKQYQLKNSLKILLLESHKAPVVAVQMWVKTGSADEKKKQEGISHFIEHLVFKGTQKYGVGEIAKIVEGSGGELNAYTTFDHTVFHITISRDYLDVGLDCISEMMGFPKFDGKEIDREREVVLEEIKRSFDNPASVAGQKLFATVFKKHPYGIPIIGYSENIKQMKRETLVEYFQNRYVPSNMTLVLAGDFDRTKIKRQISKYYGPFRNYRLKKVARKKEGVQKAPRVDYAVSEFKEASLHIAFPVPSAKHLDVPALDVLGFILAQGDSSRLVKRLRLEKSLVTYVSAGAFNPLDPGFFTVSMNFRTEHFNEIERVVLEEIEKILTVEPDASELDRARLNLEADEIYSLETVDGLARKAGVFQTLLDDPDYMEKYIKQVQKLLPKDITEVARRYFQPKRLSISMMIFKGDKQSVNPARVKTFTKNLEKVITHSQKIKLVRQKAGLRLIQQLEVSFKGTVSDGKIVKHSLPSGARLILKRNPEVPVVSIKGGFTGGLRIEPKGKGGITTVLANVWMAGSRNYSESEIAARIEGAAGSISAFGGRNSVGFSLDVLSTNHPEAFEVLCDVVSEPSFPIEAIGREISIQAQNLRTRADHPSQIAGQLFMEEIFSGHPYSNDLLGSEESLERITRQDVFDHWSKMISARNAVFVAVGDLNIDQQIVNFESLARSLKGRDRLSQVFPLAALSENRRIFRKMDKEQTHIIVGFRSIALGDPDRYTLQLLQAILAGQGGRLFIELRDKASLAYTVSPMHLEGIETGYFGVYIGCSPEKGKTAVNMINAELSKIVEKAPTEEEVERAKKYLVGRTHIDLQRNGAQASSILFDELYGIDCEETFRFADHLKALTSSDVHRFARRVLTGLSVTVAVGPVEPW